MEAAPLIIDIERLDRNGEHLTGEIPASALELDPEHDLCIPVGNIRYDLFVQLIDGELLVRGRTEQPFRCTCVRCTTVFPWESIDPAVVFSVPVEEKVFVDLTPELREGIILTFPNHPVCREECLGLCPSCGADLNRGPCSCEPPADDRWVALDSLDGE